MWGNGKRIRRVLLTALALALACATALAAMSFPFYTVTLEKVRLRKSPSTSAVVLKDVPAGDAVEVLGETSGYYKVTYMGQTGYIQKQYLSTDAGVITTPTPAPTETVQTVSGYPYSTVTRDSVNLRERQSTRSTLLKKIPAGATITVEGGGNTWIPVNYNGVSGYVMSEYVVLKQVVKVKATPTPTPVPSLSPEEDAAGYHILQRGDSGAEVRSLQLALIELGYLSGSADGNFGASTENAVIALQKRNGYPSTGIVDPNLQAFLYSGQPTDAAGSARKVSTISPAATSIKPGNTGDEVGRIQARLIELGFYTGSVTNKYDSATQSAVKNFQKKNGLTADGVVGESTYEALFSQGAMGKNATPTPEPIPTATPAPTYTLPENTVKLGSSGWEATEVQRRLYDLGYLKSKPDGKFGTQSVLALKAFQKDHGLKEDGVAGVKTCEILFDANTLALGATPTPLPTAVVVTAAPAAVAVTVAPVQSTNWKTLRKGDSNADVTLLQERLIALGYLTGTSDGSYGDRTVAAVKAFQKANGLTADGVAGAATQKILFGGTAKAATVTATATPAPTATTTNTILRRGDTGTGVENLQRKLISLGYLKGTADGIYGTKTVDAVRAFQKANGLSADGVAGAQTQQALQSGGTAKNTTTTTTTTTTTARSVKPSASQVQYANWYTTVKAVCKKYPYATVYDIATGISWQVHIFSLGAHADYEPVTASDTARMLKVFGGNTWNPRAVWVVFSDGSVYLGSTHSNPHGTQHTRDNNFDGHSCLHFPRTQAQVAAIGSYATSHQECIDKGWATTQAMK